jgi:hypothetical protein
MYSIDGSGSFIRITLTGDVLAADLQGALREVEALEAQSAFVPDRLIDLSGATDLNVAFPDVYEIAQRRHHSRFPNPFRSAVVATTPLQIGFARMFQTLNDHPQIHIRIFDNSMTAAVWLSAPSKR